MKRISLSQLTTLRWDLHQDLQIAVERGISGIGLWRPKVEDYGVDETIELLHASGVKASSLSWIGGFTGSDGRRFADAVEDAIDAVELASRLGADTLVVLPGGRNNHIKRHLEKTLSQAMIEIDAVAAAHDVRLAIEPIHPGCGDQWSFLQDIRATIDLIGGIASDNIGLVLDTYHVGGDEDLPTLLPEILPWLHLVQLGDSRRSMINEMNRCLLGEGRIPIMSILESLLSVGYDRWIEIEIQGQDVAPLGYANVIDHALDYVERSREMADQTSSASDPSDATQQKP